MLADSLSPWPCYTEEEVQAVSRVLTSGKVNYWTGTECRNFEQEFAEYCGTSHGIALANGTVALELALQAGGIGSGDDVIVTPRSFIASASCIVRCGARPVFADVSPESQNLTPESIRSVLTPNTRAIIAVHHAGWPCDMVGIMDIADEHSLMVVEDCAQAHGAKVGGCRVGGLAHVGVFSFCQDKIITTGGEGGMLVTNDKALWERAWSLKDHGKSYDAVHGREHGPGFRWLHESIGTNYRMTEMQAAIGRIQLRKLDNWVTKRNSNAQAIIQALVAAPFIRIPQPPESILHAYYRLYAFVDDRYMASGWNRDRIADSLNASGIPCLTGSCPEVYNEKAFDSGSLRPQNRLPVAQSLGSTSLAFLVHPSLTADDLLRICKAFSITLASASCQN